MEPPGEPQVCTRGRKRDYPGSEVEGNHTFVTLPAKSCGSEPHLSVPIDDTCCENEEDSALPVCTPGTKEKTSLLEESSALREDRGVLQEHKGLSSALREEIAVLKTDNEILRKKNDELSLSYKYASERLEHHERLRTHSGSYSLDEPWPTRLACQFNNAMLSVDCFQRELFDCVVKQATWSPWELLDRDPDDEYFTRDAHRKLFFRGAVNTVFYEGFENESFNTMRGVSRFPDPKHRQQMFYEYYCRAQEPLNTADLRDDIRNDPQYLSFCQMKVYSLLRKRLPAGTVNSAEVSHLEALGGSELLAAFKSAAKDVWLLHKLAFSFEPPATIFRVEKGANIDPRYMVSKIVQVDDDERLVNQVGFMVAPGLRHPHDTSKCEVYLGT